jgi:hypothetical protein
MLIDISTLLPAGRAASSTITFWTSVPGPRLEAVAQRV